MLQEALPKERPEDDRAQQRVAALVDNIEKVIFGKREVVKVCVAGLLARGHVLIEDVPGIGKTTLAQGLARSLNCGFNRIQFTSDMLPADIVGISILDPKTNQFEFRKGPIFSSIVLADEVNRTPPKTQSALLEAMSDGHVSVDGQTRPLPEPFMVLATQNPVEHEGTYTLPEAQLDRFLIRAEIGYPDTADELRIMRQRGSHNALIDLKPVLSAEEVIELQRTAEDIHVDESVAHYIIAIAQATRDHEHVRLGASPRGSLALYEACQAWALIEGRDFVTPDDVRQLAIPVLSHRLLVRSRGGSASASSHERDQIVADILKKIPIPV